MNNVIRFKRNLDWIRRNQAAGGVSVTSFNKALYPEVTGYLIPSLISWGEEALATKFGETLLKIQNSDGSYLDPSGLTKCVFDTGQVIRGLTALHLFEPSESYAIAIKKSVVWIAGLVHEDGLIHAPDHANWQGAVPEGVLLYALEPAYRAAILLGLQNEAAKINKSINYLMGDPELENHKTLTHFHAYILEALFDLGYPERARESLDQVIAERMTRKGIRGRPRVKWVCSTGMLQYSLVAFKLGDLALGDSLFRQGARLQNRSGGWFGSYGFPWRISSFPFRVLHWMQQRFDTFGRWLTDFAMYFPNEEIPWANKYFMDALSARLKLSFESMSEIFSETIEPGDGRVLWILKEIRGASPTKVLDLGCGKGRYLTHIKSEFPEISLSACDLSEKVMHKIDSSIEKRIGSIIRTGFNCEEFDLVMLVESLEHVVSLEAGLREVARILRPGGTVLIVDKNRRAKGRLQIPDWEQWFTPDDIISQLDSMGIHASVEANVGYEGKRDGLFFAIVGTKNG